MKLYQDKKFAAYSALATTFLTPSQSADGQVVHHVFIPDITIEVSAAYNGDGEESVLLDMNLDGDMDLRFNASAWGGSCSDCANDFAGYISGFNTNGIALGKFYSKSFWSGDTVIRYFAQPFSASEQILSSLDFHNGALLNWRNGDTSFLYNVGPWHTREEHFIGIKLHFDGGDHFGWLRLICDDGYMNIKDYAYSTRADEPVITGKWDEEISPDFIMHAFQGHIFATVAGGHEEQLNFMLFNMAGQKVFEYAYMPDNGQFDFSPDVPDGTYLGIIQTGQQMYSQKLIIAR